MYIHIGGEIVLRSREIVAIFDASILKQQKQLSLKQNWLMVGEQIKSIILTPTQVYASPISCATLRKRLMKQGDLPGDLSPEQSGSGFSET